MWIWLEKAVWIHEVMTWNPLNPWVKTYVFVIMGHFQNITENQSIILNIFI